ncbi:hypothetical protein OEZ86_012268 [Tetradesmus obliquus]|nr:hypothetical protein OEZ86_012268 [Tetradesmus obliquus]
MKTQISLSALGLAVLLACLAAAAPAATVEASGFQRQPLSEAQEPYDESFLEDVQSAAAGVASSEALPEPQQNAPAGTCKAAAGYTPVGKLCACAAGSGSQVPTWTNETYPVQPPACQYHDPTRDPAYNSSITFLPAGSGIGRCFCFRCPAGFTSPGGPLNSSAAACVPKLPSCSLNVRYQLSSRSSSSSACGRTVSNAAAGLLRTELKRRLRVADKDLLLLTQAAAAQEVSAAADGTKCSLTVTLTYFGRNARGKSAVTRTMAAAINAPNGACTYGVCAAIKAASKDTATVDSAAANTTKSFADVCIPLKCDDRACQAGVCTAGVCSYTPEPDGAACVDGPVPGTCRVGVCEGLKANIDSASQGETEPVIFKARFANMGQRVILQGLSNNATNGTRRAAADAFTDAIGELFDDGQRIHDDRYAGDGLYSNTINIKFEKTDVPVYKEFYISQLEKLLSSTIEIAAITTDYDTLLQVFPTQALVADAQQQLDRLLASGVAVAQATQQVYDTLLAKSGGTRRALLSAADTTSASVGPSQFDDSIPLQPIDIKAILARVDRASLTRRCAGGEESADIAALFQTAGYNVKFKCNDPVLCPEGPPSLDDYTGWSKYCFVAVSTIGDSDPVGEFPIIVARAPTDFSPERQQDWQAGRMVLTGDGLFALRPSWFEKYRNAAAGGPPGRTVVYFAADRSAIAAGSFQDQQARGFASAFYGMIGSVSYAGYDSSLSLKFPGVSPGIAITKYLLSGGNVNAYAAGGAGGVDSVTGARLRSYTFRASLVTDRCRLVCSGQVCPPPPPCAAASEASCNPLSGTCDTSCCDKQDGEACTLRGRQSSCSSGTCLDLCSAPLCSAPPCQQLADASGSPVNTSAAIICDPSSGTCSTTSLPDASSCVFQGGPGACFSGSCTRVHSINYLLQGPAASFPSLLASDAAIAAMQAAVYGSLGLTPAYPLSSIQVNLLKTLGTARAAAQPAGTLDSSIAAAAAAAVQPATERRAIFKAAIADQPKGQLPPNIGFLLIASPALLVPTLPFGPGLTAQACDEDGNILNPIDYCKIRPCGAGTVCEKAECDPIDGACSLSNKENGSPCVDGGLVGVCQSGKCQPEAIPPPNPCNSQPCNSLAGAALNTCVQRGNSLQFDCSCLPGFQWTGAACAAIPNPCAGSPCDGLARAVRSSCIALDSSRFSCSCEQGYQWNGAACIGVDPCASNPCANIQKANPTSCSSISPFSWSCSCTFGYIWNQASRTCVDENGCQGTNCNTIENAVPGSCSDVAAPGVGFNCRCDAGFKWDPATAKCVGACVSNPCTDTACRTGRCTGDEFCTYTARNEGQPCELPISRQSVRRAAAMYATTCQSGLCATKLLVCTPNTGCGAGNCCCGSECVPAQNDSCDYTCANIACQNKGAPRGCSCIKNCAGSNCSSVGGGDICQDQGVCCCAKTLPAGETLEAACRPN